ncbi:YdcF family protein [Halalkalibacter okhensis]|uniref:Cytoplasmic protein n=1 Tax=Halalkalibacter okhensis TaxID=333138 RepID=A0A0B0IGZ5_9BACI|nr:YdcF family protein [Halalkalibacter okhensis]KHF38916.1 cytoplasmic protein [Halalkalibacter okhensis]
MIRTKGFLPIIISGFIILLIYVCFLHVQILRYCSVEMDEEIDYVIILGASVKGTEPSLSLQYRIDAAAQYLLQNIEAVVIASGGQGPGEDISEAMAIKTELMRKGIDESRIYLEDESTSTVENISLAKAYLPELAGKGLVVTNSYHIFRAIQIAKDNELDVSGLPAKTPRAVLVQSYVREYLALTKYFLTRKSRK